MRRTLFNCLRSGESYLLEEDMFNKYFDDIKIGDKIVSEGRTVTEEDVQEFVKLSGDNFPLHTDSEYARNSLFGERIAHGLLVLSIASGLIPPHAPYTIAFYGMNNVRFVNPTRFGDTIRAEVEVIGKEERNDQSGIITYRQTAKNQKDEDVAVGNMKALLAREKKKK